MQEPLRIADLYFTNRDRGSARIWPFSAFVAPERRISVAMITALVRGQKLPIFSLPGMPHLTLATQIAAQATSSGRPFRVVFAAMGLTHADIY